MIVEPDIIHSNESCQDVAARRYNLNLEPIL
jgi:hypothetical protein